MALARERLSLPEEVLGRACGGTSTTSVSSPWRSLNTPATASRRRARASGSEIRHCTSTTTVSSPSEGTENTATSPLRRASVSASAVHSRSCGQTLRPLTMIRSLARPVMTISSPVK